MGFLSEGKKKESFFSSHLKSFSVSSVHEDMTEHWDLKMETRIDVKGLKKIKRSDLFTNENYHFIEIINVHGKLGWLYGEKVDYFAFETNHYWILVKKETLQEFVKNNVSKIQVDSTDKALYCFYSREGRKDKMTLIKTLDLMFISTEIIKKEVDIIGHEPGDSIIPEIREKQRLSKALKK